MEQCRRKMASGRRAAGAIRSLVNARYFQLEGARILNETMLIPVLMYGSETMLREEERYVTRAIKMNNLRGMLGNRRKDRVPSTRIRRCIKDWKSICSEQTT